METLFVLTTESKLINHGANAGANYKRKLGNHTEPILFPRPLPDVDSTKQVSGEKMNIIKAMLHVLSYKHSLRMLSGIEAEPVFRSSRIWIA